MNNKKWLDKISPLITANAQPASVSPESREQAKTDSKPATVPARSNGKHPGGRPSLKTPELLDEICNEIASGRLLNEICQSEHMPVRVTVQEWAQADTEFRNRLNSARRKQAEILAEQVVSLADNCEETHEAIGKCRLMMQGRQWLSGAYNPQFAKDKAGDIHVTTAVNVAVMSMERQRELQDRLAKALEGAQP